MATRTTQSIRGTTQVTGVWGYPIKHSASPAMHNAAFAHLGLDWVYIPFAVAPTPENVAQAVAGIRALGIAGVNVTVPLKEIVPPYLDELTDRARRLGAVNTIVNRDGHLLGDSTDGDGFLAALQDVGVSVGTASRVVVLGAGGSARAVVDALAQTGCQIFIANRNRERAEALASHLGAGYAQVVAWDADTLADAAQTADVLVNTTTLGMSPHQDNVPPIPLDALSPSCFVTDLVYNPATTLLLRHARQQGCRTQNGVAMLVHQGALAFARWTGQQAPVSVMRDAVEAFLARQE